MSSHASAYLNRLKMTKGPIFFAVVVVVCLSLFFMIQSIFILPDATGDASFLKGLEFFPASSRTSSPRVTFVTYQTGFSLGWCRMITSAIFSNVAVITLGIGHRYSHARRPQWVRRFIELEALKDDDIVFFFDGGDTFFTGAFTLQRAIQKFISSTPAKETDFDAEAVHNGTMTAPVLFGTEPECYGPEMWSNNIQLSTRCMQMYTTAWEAAGYRHKSEHRSKIEPGKSPFRYLNGGSYIARVWALKKALDVLQNLLRTRPRWWCDQSMWSTLYLYSVARESTVNPNLVIPYGLISIDYHVDVFVCPYDDFKTIGLQPWSADEIQEFIDENEPPFPHFFNIAENRDATPAVVHFPGPRKAYPSILPEVVNRTAWVYETRLSSKKEEKSIRFLAEEATVEVRRGTNFPKILKLNDVCPVLKVINLKWLSTVHRK